jgi:phosphatidylserine/phosphatidylglycerophosphate/cardiolipin synthase-like enzyme
MMIVDSTMLHVYGFNFTTLDMAKSRSFGVMTRNRKLVQEACKLFGADFDRQPYMPSNPRFVVSPENAREMLARFLRGARHDLRIYDPKVSDDAMLRILLELQKAGVTLKIIGKVEAKWRLDGQKYPGRRLHVRAIIRDGRQAFIGSQSLRRLELEKRREIGIIVDDLKTVRGLMKVFDEDWALTDAGRKEAKKAQKKAS